MKKIWTKNTLQQEALKYKRRIDFKNGSPGAYDAALNTKVMDEICSHMKILRNKWTLEAIQQEALKYESRNAFRKGSNDAYIAAFGKRILDEVCSHMPRDRKIGRKPHNYKWTLEAIQQEALKYEKRHEFKKGNEGAYDAAKTMKILDIVCSHMRNSINSSKYERMVMMEIRTIYPTATKLRKRNILVTDKPWIKGFDIDIYIPELQKGIEIDGHYWHSLEIMRKTKPTWPSEDVLGYHRIKDEYFMSQYNVKILHISDLDLINDFQQSLNKIFEFLRS